MTVNPAPDFEKLVRNRLVDYLGIDSGRISRKFPEPLSGNEIWVMVNHVGGQSDELNLYPVVDIDVFSRNVSLAKSLAAQVSAELLGYARPVSIDGRTYAIARADSISDPVERPYDDSSTARIGASYELPLRR